MEDLLVQRGYQDAESRTGPPAGRNKECPINNLPPEILIIIFQIALESRPPNTTYWKALRALRLVSVRWSSVIDQAATLWATTSCSDSEEEVKMALRKSAGALLDVTCMFTPVQYDYAALVLPHSPRWRSLEAKTNDPETITDLMSGRMPNLRSLTVLWEPGWAGPPLLRLDQTTYQLRDLTIWCCSLSGFQFTFPYLRRLGLFGLSPEGPSVDQVVAVLAGCAGSLEVLALVNSVIRPHHEQFCLKSRISLPKLKKLTLGGINGSSVAQILGSIELPSSVMALVNIMDRDFQRSEVLDQVTRPITSITNIVEGEMFRVVLGRLGILFGFRYIKLLVSFAGENGQLPTSDELHETLRTVLQGSLGPALRQYRPWLNIGRTEFPSQNCRPERILEICHSSFPDTGSLIIQDEDGVEDLIHTLALEVETAGGPLWLFSQLEDVRLLSKENDVACLQACVALAMSRLQNGFTKSFTKLQIFERMGG